MSLLAIYRLCAALSAVCCIASFPVEGLPGAALGLAAGVFAIPVIVLYRRSKQGGVR
jgi:hypothetical protein